MFKQTFLIGTFVISVFLPSCSSVPQPEPREMDSRVRMLEKELQAERERVKELTRQLEAVRATPSEPSIPVAELIAVPEEYVGKEILLEGEVTQPPLWREHVTYFLVKDLKGNASLPCYFKTQELDRDSRRLLVNKKSGQKIKITGQLAKTAGGLSSQVTIRSERGYEFHVSKVIE